MLVDRGNKFHYRVILLETFAKVRFTNNFHMQVLLQPPLN